MVQVLYTGLYLQLLILLDKLRPRPTRNQSSELNLGSRTQRLVRRRTKSAGSSPVFNRERCTFEGAKIFETSQPRRELTTTAWETASSASSNGYFFSRLSSLIASWVLASDSRTTERAHERSHSKMHAEANRKRAQKKAKPGNWDALQRRRSLSLR